MNIPQSTYQQWHRLHRWWQRQRNPARFGTLRRTTPLSDSWGFDRGVPIDRYYIDRFLSQHRQDIRGRVLEVKNTGYTNQFGNEVTQRDVLDISTNNPHATIVADLQAADGIPANQFDCFILTQTLQFIQNTHACIAHAHRILRPGGVLLVTVPCISRIAPRYGLETDYWRFTAASCAALFGEVFGAKQIVIHSYGNVLTGIAFLAGAACEEISVRELDQHDPYFPLVISVRAVKAE